MSEQNEDKPMTIEETTRILSNTLQDVALRRTTLRRALVVSRLALAFMKAVEVNNLQRRLEFLEEVLKKRKP